MTFRICPDGTLLCLWTDRINLRRFGSVKVRRASTIEYDHRRQDWVVSVGRRILFRNPDREVCASWERRNDHRILDLAFNHASSTTQETATTSPTQGRRRLARNTSASREHHQSSRRLSRRRGARRR